jgi:phosphoglycerate kinase
MFANGSKIIAEAMCQTSANTIVGGGDTIEALKKFCDPAKIDHVSLAGGATLDFLAGKTLPVIELLKGDK